ncbi:C-terminal helicase domain-containing protein, partial [Streptomyces caniscabiei]|uniref:C-terminal helicase domain-containing protein n=1 Tax=Streptomyces caniscabiei TaxID=2746961 RepID=UPI0038F6E997
KLIVFTEHRDTLHYLQGRIGTLLGRPDAVKAIHGGVRRAERRQITEEFTRNPGVRILLATDAAGEGLNLQAAHLMVNYDLPW